MGGKIILQIMKSILLIMKIILRIVILGTGYAERIRKCQEKVHIYKSIWFFFNLVEKYMFHR